MEKFIRQCPQCEKNIEHKTLASQIKKTGHVCRACALKNKKSVTTVNLSASVAFNDKGLSSININGTNILTPLASPAGTFTSPTISDIKFRKSTDTTPLIDRASKASTIFFAGSKTIVTKSFNNQTKTLTLQYSWGKIDVNYTVNNITSLKKQIDVNISVTNQSSDILSLLDIQIFKLILSSDALFPIVGEAVYFGSASTITSMNSLSGPVVLPLTTAKYSMIACSPETTKSLKLYWGSSTTNNIVSKTVNLHVGGDLPLHDNVYDTREILPGESDTYVASLRFHPTNYRASAVDSLGAGTGAAANDIFTAYATAHPMVLNWSNRKPINRTFVGDQYSADNGNILSFNQAANWNNEENVAVPSPAIDPATAIKWKTTMLPQINSQIASCKLVDTQGIIVWNIEGNSNITDYGYTGSKSVTLSASQAYSSTTSEITSSAALIRSLVMNGYKFRAVFNNGVGTPVTSAAATLTIQTASITPVAPIITANPINQAVISGGIMSFTAVASGYPVPNVQWQVNTGSGYSNLIDNSGYSTSPENIGTLIPGCIYSGSGTNTLTIARATISQNGYLYRAVFTNTSGTVTTTAATLTVQTATITNVAPTIIVQPTNQTTKPYIMEKLRTDNSTRFVIIVSAKFTAVANCYPVPAIQWQVSTDGGITYTNVVENGTQMMWSKYVGDPSSISIYSPTAHLAADEYFKKFTDAGIKVGVCLRTTLCRRHSVVGGTWNTHSLGQYDDYTRSVVDILSEKVDYAFNRWGCTLFYVDSNSFTRQLSEAGKVTRQLMSADEWNTLSRKYPNMLFIPEHSYYRCYTSSVAYDQMDNLPGGYAGVTPPIVKKTWPKAFKCLMLPTNNGSSVRQYGKMVNAIKQGDILMSNLTPVIEANATWMIAAQNEAEYFRLGEPLIVSQATITQLINLALNSTDPRVLFFVSRRLSPLLNGGKKY